MARAAFTLRVQGLKELQHKLKPEELLHEPYRDALDDAARTARDIIARGAPRGRSGNLTSKLTYRVQKGEVPRYAVVKTTATRSSKKYRRYSYPRRLEFDPKSRHKDWLLNGLLRAKGAVQSILGNMAREIAHRWSR